LHADSHYATGVASVKAEGNICVVKRPVRARSFVRLSAYQEWLESLGPDTTYLMGHTRWPTRGSVLNPENNHPLVSERPGPIVAATHNGSLLEVDSELLLRIAERHSGDSGLDLDGFLGDLEPLAGLMSAAFVVSSKPGEVVLLKGNKPLEVRYHSGLGIVAYASEAGIVDAALAREGWQEVTMDDYEGLIIHVEDELHLQRFEFRFGEALPSHRQC
jgi:hypothetical protein